MKKLLLCLSFFMICGCFSNNSMKIPKGNKGEAKQEERSQKEITGEIEGDVHLPEIPADGLQTKKDPWKIKIDGIDVEVPYGSKGNFKVNSSGSSSSDSFTQMLSSWKVNSAPVQLFIFGGIIVAVGVGLIIFGLSKFGIVCLGVGFSLIACGVVINQYPWVFLIVVLLGLVIGGYFLYVQYSKKKLQGEKLNQEYVLEKFVKIIESLSEDTQSYIKKSLKEDDQSGVIRKVTHKARKID